MAGFLLALALCGARSAPAQQADPSAAETLRRELAATRRVGYLRRESGSNGYSLQDNWDKQTYKVHAAQGLDLEPFVDRYVTLRGETLAAEAGAHTFVTQRVTALDGRQPASGRTATVQRASLAVEVPESLEGLEGESSARPNRVAALADGLPRPSEVLEEIQAPPVVNSTSPNAASSTLTPPVTEWLGVEGVGFMTPPDRWWTRAEYLYWLYDGMQTPPLVTTSPIGTPRTDAGVLGEPGTTVLFGGGLNNEWQSGGRAQLGYWVNLDRTFGVEAEAVWFPEQDASFAARSLGSPILARPFFDALNGEDSAELVAYPGVLRGEVLVDATTQFYSGGLRARLNSCGARACDCTPRARRIDCLIGYRYTRLQDSLVIQEDLVSLDPLNQGLFEITDAFNSNNEFHGIDVGFVEQFSRGNFSFEWITKVALGINQQSVTINGFSIIDEAGLVEGFRGGLLAQRTNIGNYNRDEFALIPELSATIGWHINSRLTLTLGYTLVYFTNVVRAGDQIDLAVNTNLLPPEADPFSGPLLPAFAFRDTNFWVHGASIGADYRW